MKNMKKIIHVVALAGFLLGSVSAHASKEGWLTSFDEALAKAKAEDKHVLIEFHGSDWCPPCKKLNAEVLTTDAFKELADSSLVLVDIDFPRKTSLPEQQKAHNEALAGKFEIRGLPTVLILDGDGNVLDKLVGYPQGGLDGFLGFINAKITPEG
jgi:thioredoxin-related protein